MTELAINRSVEPRTWVLQEGYRLLAYLQLGRSGANSGEVKREDEVWQISSRRRRPEEVVLGEPADPIVTFDRDEATLRGVPDPLPWTFSGRLSRWRAVLGSGDEAITVETAGWRPLATGRSVGGCHNVENIPGTLDSVYSDQRSQLPPFIRCQ